MCRYNIEELKDMLNRVVDSMRTSSTTDKAWRAFRLEKALEELGEKRQQVVDLRKELSVVSAELDYAKESLSAMREQDALWEALYSKNDRELRKRISELEISHTQEKVNVS